MDDLMKKYVAADQRLKKEAAEWASRSGSLRSELSTLRHSLLSCLPEGTQHAVAMTGQSGVTYVRRVNQTHRRQITAKVLSDSVRAAFEAADGEGSRDDLRKAILEQVKQRVVTRRPCVDISTTPARRKAGESPPTSVEATDPLIAQMGREMAQLKAKLGVLIKEKARALASPKRRVTELQGQAEKILPRLGNRVRVQSTDRNSPDFFVGTKVRQARGSAGKRVTLKQLDSLLDTALSCELPEDGPLSLSVVAAVVTTTFETFQRITKDRVGEIAVYKGRLRTDKKGK